MAIQDFQHVVVGMDGAQLADGAIETALQLAPLLGARLHVVHTLDLHGIRAWFEDANKTARVYAELQQHARANRLSHLLELGTATGLTAADAENALIVHVGRPAPTLLRECSQLAAPLIVLGAHLERDLFDFGGTSREILSAATTPIWFQPRAWQPIRRILAAVDLSDASGPTLAVARRLANLLTAQLVVLHAFEPPTVAFKGFDPTAALAADKARAQQEFETLLRDELTPGTVYESEFVEGRPADRILERQDTADLIVLGSHGNTNFTRVMLGSQAHRVTRRATCPVVIVPQRAPDRLAASTAES